MKPGHTLTELVAVMDRLLAPDGCPWDREQTLDSLRPFLLEETYEVLEAVERGTPAEHCEELGDLLMQIVFQAALRRAQGAFDIDDVVRGIAGKLVRRHPHVFGDATAATADEVLTQWAKIKEAEKKASGAAAADDSVLAGVPRALPALARAQQLGGRAGRVGFDWPEIGGTRKKIDEELGEVDAAVAGGDRSRIAAEVGDLLFAVVNLARKLEVDAESALRGADQRFEARFRFIEDQLRAQGRTPRDADLTELDALWDRAKASGL
ncbi:MAG TPA: nucleoside triphosphate pyrophosphohydrolase [Kofleriaceae bacterium]|nr:nucleoside triphosphate pyrophosphohydrolase [Kofleriaceae bacterium]